MGRTPLPGSAEKRKGGAQNSTAKKRSRERSGLVDPRSSCGISLQPRLIAARVESRKGRSGAVAVRNHVVPFLRRLSQPPSTAQYIGVTAELGCEESVAMRRPSSLAATATILTFAAAFLPGTNSLAEAELYTLTNLGLPPGAVSVIGVRMNNAGDVAGWSSFSEAPFLRGWSWTEEGGFTVLPPPPGFTRYRAMDISDTGTIVGDGGFDSGLAWRYEDGLFTVIGAVRRTVHQLSRWRQRRG